MFHDALHIATRCATLSHQYSASQYGWYTRRIREIYSCSFLALLLGSEQQQLAQENMSAAWAVLDQLFPTDNTGQPVDVELQDSPLGRILVKARMKRGLQIQIPMTQQLRDQAINAATGGFPTNMATQASVTSRAAIGQTTTFQSSGNLFEDWDALMQEPLWHGGAPGADNYWV